PGLPPYLLRRSVATTPMLEKIAAHQVHVAEVYGLPIDKARWLLATLAFHCIAGADTIYSIADDEDGQVITDFWQGLRALVIGSLQDLKEDGADRSP
ncbi:TetR/AcrR family transcriptional regulator, partial [Pseudomonas stutzeri]|nr:TetR/AcrR family transcriptional regulator [Stutzerimonas stutzeri]